MGLAVATAAVSVALVTTIGAGQAHAAAAPTPAVTQSGNTDWAITFDRGRSNSTTCDLYVDGVKRLAKTPERSVVLAGATTPAGRHPVSVRCGGRPSPTIWVTAPRSQINDIATWSATPPPGSSASESRGPQRQPSSGATCVSNDSMTWALYSTPSWLGIVNSRVSADSIASSSRSSLIN